ncbi:hypothetical protein H001_02450 [Escherichia coli UMEA 3955-1]|nr:hypothetical protein H001_02450 [Escherichia coli UMEA 3955-1]
MPLQVEVEGVHGNYFLSTLRRMNGSTHFISMRLTVNMHRT